MAVCQGDGSTDIYVFISFYKFEPAERSTDQLTEQCILSRLPEELQSKFISKLFIFDSLESTNITAKEMALAGATHGTAVIANYQTAGKGRGGKSFHSPSGSGIYMSSVLDTSVLGFSTPTLVTAHAAVCVCETIESLSSKVPQIKWVNDVFIGGKKVCGILTEAVTARAVVRNTGGQFPSVIVGIGVNFVTPADGFPTELQSIAGSVFGLDVPPVTREQFIAGLITRIAYPSDGFNENEMLDKYRQRMLLLDKRVLIRGSGMAESADSFEATAIAVDDMGQLVIKKDSGEILSLIAGDVSVAGY